jgi:transposase
MPLGAEGGIYWSQTITASCTASARRFDEPVAGMAQNDTPRSLAVTRAAASRSIAKRLEGSARASQRPSLEVTDLPPIAETTSTPACSKAQDARRLGAKRRSVMRSVGLDLGVRHISYCEVADGEVIDRTTVRSLSGLTSRIGPNSAPARVAFEACREGWHVHDTLSRWGHEPHMLDTTRIRTIGVGHHKRKNDAIDAEAIAQAVDAGRLPEAHVLSPERRALRAQLSVRGALVETRAQYVTTIRGLIRAAGVLLPTCHSENMVSRLETVTLDDSTRALVAPLVAILNAIEPQIAYVEQILAGFAEKDPILQLCATVPGVGLIVAATFVSVIDEAKRFKNAHAVGAYLGLVPGEATTGGPNKRRLGSITKQGNRMARVMLIQAAWMILRSRHLDDPLKRWGDHLVQTRGKKIAVVALARKLAGVLWAMWRDGTVYDRAWQAEQTARGVTSAANDQSRRAHALSQAARKLERRPAAIPVATTAPAPTVSGPQPQTEGSPM